MSWFYWVLIGLYCIPVAIGFLVAMTTGILAMGFTGDYSSSGALAIWNGFVQFWIIMIIFLFWPIGIPVFNYLENRE